jgi:hypothetical protein
MPTLPRATTVVEDTASAAVGGIDTVCVIAPHATQPDIIPRLYGSAKAIFDVHGYGEGVEYCSVHAERTRKNFLYVAIPIVTPGVVGREDKSGNTGGSVSTVTAGGDGVLAEHDGAIRVDTGGTVGTSQIKLSLSMDGQRTWKPYRLGTATSLSIPFFNVSVSFTVGTLVAGDIIHTWHGTAPKGDADGWQAAREALAAQQKGFRSALLVGDLSTDTEAGAFLTQLEAYETANERFIYGRCSVRDRLPEAELSHNVARMTAGTSLTFDGTADTIERATGSWLAEGFAIGDTVTFLSEDNDFTTLITDLTATLMSVTAAGVDADEVTANATCVAYPTLTFLEVGASGDTITRNRGDWRADGFRAGDLIDIEGTASNDDVEAGVVTTVTALVLTLGSQPAGDLDNETISTNGVTITAGETKAEWMATLDAEFASIDDAPRIDIAAGRGRVLSPFSGWFMRRSAGWFASWREYQHDLHIATWRKDDGDVGADLYDEDGQLVEWDDRVDGEAATAAKFTSLRTWANDGPVAFIARSLTRALDGSLLGDTHNEAVVNLACATVQLNSENAAIGQSLILNSDGTASKDSLSLIEARVNAALDQNLLTNRGEGPRASMAVWSIDPNTLFNVAEPLMLGTLNLLLNGTVHSVRTAVRVLSG